ncbi:tryptophan synthase beta subunit-like PLP-dependent enzyme [Sistotremastrum niveocremeum HHB9708]|uniref:L-serine ammonia-lyase n=1 Tax=Sistotremastrum niveocremeum HHB9708 TaxID=1314777 RepID=A0A164QZK0_9AGAM|nr:tryptophan synthase beta subunit-like PLP-dependent enzyme [Sistotremastrum niveocremeum HHB9708]
MAPLWRHTPVIHSRHLSRLLGCSVYLKLENLQISQSFKYRGLSLFIQEVKEKHGSSAHLVIASGGNAGLAAAYAAQKLGLQCTVYIFEGLPLDVQTALEDGGANVQVVGKNYVEAFAAAVAHVARDPDAVMVPAYDHPTVWSGHGSMIEEIAAELPNPPKAILCSVGGGGLLGGVLVGCDKVGWENVPVVALETHGSACFYHSLLLSRPSDPPYVPPDFVTPVKVSDRITLAKIVPNSRVSSLGASSPAKEVVEMALDHPGTVKCVTVPDELSMLAAMRIAAEHKFLVETACSTTIVPAYHEGTLERILGAPLTPDDSLVFIVCGGTKISVEELEEYKSDIKQMPPTKVYMNIEGDSMYLGELPVLSSFLTMG